MAHGDLICLRCVFRQGLLLGLGLVCLLSPVLGQDGSDDRERQTTERFLEVLKRRPRPGTALDRVYGYHVRNGSIDELVASLSASEGEASPGPSRMILGLIQLQRGRGADAVTALKEAETLLPNDAAASYYLGRALLSIGETEQAAAAMERAIQRRPARNEALPMFTELGRIYGRAGLTDKALDVWTGLEELFPGDTRVGGQIARTLAEEGNLEAALQRFENLARTARRQEQQIAFSVQASEIKRRLGQPEEATSDLETILARLRPGSWLYADVRSRIEQGFLKSGNYDALADYYQNKVEEQSDNLELLTRLGSVLVSAGRLDEASDVLNSAITRAPEDPSVRMALIDVLLRQSDSRGAAAQFAKLAEQDPGNPDYLLRWGQILLEDPDVPLEERRKAASEVWMRLADSRSDDAVSMAQVADRLRSIDQTDEAIRLYRRAIELDPQAPQYREYLGEYLHQLDRREEAVEAWKAIAAEERRNVDSLIRLAEIFNTFKMPDESLETWAQAAENDLTFSQELRYASQLRTGKQYETALKRLDRAAELAETPDEREQLLRERITTFSDEGTLSERIARLASQETRSLAENRRLALMHQAAGQLTDAAFSIQEALKAEPENVAALTVAADIYERQNRFADAVQAYEKLGTIDQRFQTSYLEKVAQLQIRLGLANDALKTCEALIDANPASSENYQFAARTAFRMGRSDEGTEFLRRAMTVARRDNGPRLMLAAHFAEQYRTDEAIDLYWQAIDLTTKTEDRISVISRLAPLYERKGEFAKLLERVEELGAKENDLRATQLMLASANEAVQDFGAARQAVDQLLARQPRDVSLLENMVRLCDAADELELAIDYQKRITDLANTPDNRFRLMRLQLDAGTIDVAEALSRQVSMTSDPSRIAGMIRGSAGRGDVDSAIALAEAVVKKDDSLWDVRFMLAQLLLHQTEEENSESSESESTETATTEKAGENASGVVLSPLQQRAVELCESLLESDTGPNERPPSASKGRSSASRSNSAEAVSPRSWSNGGYDIARAYRLGQYARYYYGSQRGVALVEPSCFGHAQTLARTLIAVAHAKQLDASEFERWLKDYHAQQTTLPDDITGVTDPAVIWKSEATSSLLGYLLDPSTASGSLLPDAEKPDWKRRNDITWRLFELDPQNAASRAQGILNARFQTTRKAAAQAEKLAAGETVKQDEKVKRPKPLSDHRINLMLAHYDQMAEKVRSDPKQSSATLWKLTSLLRNELELAGKTDQASKFQLDALPEDAGVQELVSAIGFYLSMNETDKADDLVSRLLPAVRRDQKAGQSTKGLRSSSISGSIGSTFSSEANSFTKRHWKELLDVVLAVRIRESSGAQRRRRSTIGSGTVRVYYKRRPDSGGWSSSEVKAPLATELLSESLAREITSLSTVTFESEEPLSPGFVDPEMIDHLLTIPDGATIEEQKSRQVLAAYAHWWNRRPESCYDLLEQLASDFPDDVNIRIEQARLASELGDDRRALDILDTFEPLDSEMLVRKEMAAMNLAVRVGDQKRSAQAAERLFGMRMATGTQLALSRQLRTLGMKDKADAILQRMRGGRRQDESTMLQIAQAFLQAEDQEAAAEVAYGLLRRSNRRSQQGNSDYYRNQAVSILQTAGRLEPLVAMAKRRVESAPKSVAARTELAELYTAAGEKDKADALWAEIESSRVIQPQQMISQAERLAKANQPKEALKLFFKAFRKQPGLMDNQFYEMRNVVQRHNLWDEMYAELSTLKVEMIPEYRIDELLRNYGDNKDLTDNKRKFIKRLLSRRGIRSGVSEILASIPKEERGSFPELRSMVLREGTSDASYSGSGSIWSVNSYSSGGTAMGVLKPLIETVEADDDLKKEFTEKLKSNLEDQKKFVQTQILLSLLSLSSGDKAVRQQALDGIQDAITKLQDSKPEDVLCHGDLLWQAGQILESELDSDNQAATLVAFYEAARARSGRNGPGNQPQYTIVPRLVNAYRKAGLTLKAREELMRAYRVADYSEQNRYNPGYGDYQDLQTWKWVADQLVACNLPVDAIGIYGRAISLPKKFEQSRRWGGGNTLEEFQTAHKQAASKVNSENASFWLTTVLLSQLNSSRDEQADSKQTLQLELMSLPMSAFADIDAKPTLLLAARKASESEDGKKVLKDIRRKLDDRRQKEGADWSLSAASVVIASVIQPDAIPDLATAFMTALSSAADKNERGQSAVREDATRILTSFVVLDAIREADVSIDESVHEQIMLHLLTAAETLNDVETRLLLQSRFGDPEKSARTLLAEVEADTNEKAPAPQVVDTLLRVAESAADAGRLEQSAKALLLATRWGPGLELLTPSSTRDAFAIQNSRSSSRRPQQNPRDAQVVASVNAVAQKLVARLGELESPAHSVSQAVYTAIRNVVLPDLRPKVIALYQVKIADFDNYVRLPDNRIPELMSAGRLLAQLASQQGQVDSLLAEFESRSADPVVLATMKLHLARASGDADAFSSAFADFESAADEWLPEADAAAAVSPSGGISITAAVQQQSAQIAESVNKVLHAIWEYDATTYGAAEGVEQRRQKVLDRTIALINSEIWTAQRLQGIREVLENRQFEAAASKGDRSVLGAYLERIGKAMSLSYLGREEDLAMAKASKLFRLFSQLKKADGLVTADTVLRPMLESMQGAKGYPNDPKNQTITSVIRNLTTLPDSDQYAVLKRTIMGQNENDEIVHAFGIVRYSDIPEPVIEQALESKKNADVVTCEIAPVTDIALVFARQCVAAGESEAVIADLKSRSSQPLDTAGLVAALIELTAAGDEGFQAVEDTLMAIRNQLNEAKPTEDDPKLRYPELETVLVLQACNAGMPAELADQLTSLLKVYATRGQKNPIVSVLGLARARMGFGRAANASEASPLKHLVPVTIPWPTDSLIANQKPVHAINGAGWVSSTGGQNINMLMLKFPLAGDFEVSADIRDGSWGEADLTYGGTLYQPQGWDEKAEINLLRGSTSFKVDVTNIQKGQANQEGLEVSGETVSGICNGKVYYKDNRAMDYPWLGVTQYLYKTTQWKGLKISGTPVIPREVNLLSKQMRGWAASYYGQMLPDPEFKVPEAGKAPAVAESRYGRWSFVDGELKYPDNSRADANRYDPGGLLNYQRPIFSGEQLTVEFFWDSGVCEVHPAVGPLTFQLSDEGVKLGLGWHQSASDLSHMDRLRGEDSIKQWRLLSEDIVPADKSWNTLRLSRDGDQMTAQMNEKTLLTWPVTDQTAWPGFVRDTGVQSRIRNMILTGNWPETVPEDLMERAESSDSTD